MISVTLTVSPVGTAMLASLEVAAGLLSAALLLLTLEDDEVADVVLDVEESAVVVPPPQAVTTSAVAVSIPMGNSRFLVMLMCIHFSFIRSKRRDSWWVLDTR